MGFAPGGPAERHISAGRSEGDKGLDKELYHPGTATVTGREWPRSQLCRVDLEKVDDFPSGENITPRQMTQPVALYKKTSQRRHPTEQGTRWRRRKSPDSQDKNNLLP